MGIAYYVDNKVDAVIAGQSRGEGGRSRRATCS